MKLHKRSGWIIGLIVLATLSILLTQVTAARAAYDFVHVFDIYFQVESEIMQKTSAGLYYDRLLRKHSKEIGQIALNHPENIENFVQALYLFAPALESMLDEKGHTVWITSEQINALNTQLDFYALKGSPALREDIEKERERLQPDIFAGMTMQEAWDFINLTWTADPVMPPLLVPESNGKWAYYVHDGGVYLEYPASYTFEVYDTLIVFKPSANMPMQWHPLEIIVHINQIPASEMGIAHPYARYKYPEGMMVWERIISNSEFEGVEFVLNLPDLPDMDFRAFQYNQGSQLAVEIDLSTKENPHFPDGYDYFAMINQRYEYFQHMIDNLHIQEP